MSLIESESVKIVEGVVSEITINRPESLNALNTDVLLGLLQAMKRLSARTDVRAVIVTGSGEKAFVAGADITNMVDLGERAIADYVELGQRAMRSLELAPFPVIAAVNGYALGGGLELALACDLIIASKSAKFGQPEVNLGIIPGFGGTQRLVHRVGLGAARRLVYMGEIVPAEEALRLGVVDRLSEPGELLKDARAWAVVLSQKAPLAVAKAKEVFREATDPQLLSGLRHEVQGFLDLFPSVDREEGMRAFMQKRQPNFLKR